MTTKSSVEYKAIAWVSEIQFCVRSMALSSMACPSLLLGGSPARSTCQIKMDRSLGETLIVLNQGLLAHALTGPGFSSASGELFSRPRYCGRTHFRAVHGDQFGHRGDRPDQANRDHDGDTDDPCALSSDQH